MKKVSNDLVSVIIPVYNVEDYLDKCVKSVINQTYKNLEIILVDDGGKDKCPKMCDEYAKNDKRIKVIHKNNGGISDARNAGIKLSTGKYITFIDSDDYVSNDYIEFLYNLIIKYDADISIGKHYIIYPDRTINASSNNFYEINNHDIFEHLLYDEDFDVSSWAKLYKRKLFDDISFPVGRLFEDAATTYKLILKSKKTVMDSKPIYYYVIRNNSITTSSFNEKKLDLIKSTKEMTDTLRKEYEDLRDACDRRDMYAYLSTLTQLAKSKNTNIKVKNELMSYIKKNRKKVLKNKRIPKRDRIALYSTFLGFSFFKFSFKLYDNLHLKK